MSYSIYPKSLIAYGLNLLALVLVVTACSSSKDIAKDGGFSPAEITPEELVQQMQKSGLNSIEGKSKAMISQPGNTDKASLNFKSTRTETLIEVKNRIGIEGGLLYLTEDSVLLYNRVDKYAKKTGRRSGQLQELSGISPVNILQILDYQIEADAISQLRSNGEILQVVLNNDTMLKLRADTKQIRSIDQPYRSDVPFSKLNFEGYSPIAGYSLPRKITIINSGRNTKVVLLMQNIEVNNEDMSLKPDIPANIKVERL